MEDKDFMPHGLTLKERNVLAITGVTDVVSFDEDAVILRTTQGTLTVLGAQLQLKTLSPEGGRVDIEGTVSAMQYEQTRQRGGWLHRLLS